VQSACQGASVRLFYLRNLGCGYLRLDALCLGCGLLATAAVKDSAYMLFDVRLAPSRDYAKVLQRACELCVVACARVRTRKSGRSGDSSNEFGIIQLYTDRGRPGGCKTRGRIAYNLQCPGPPHITIMPGGGPRRDGD
jgi:hypothetical protein